MQEPAVEVLFCDLCGTSVPAADLESGKAVRHEGKTIGVCCLEPLRRGAAAPAASGARAGHAQPADGGRLLTVGIVLLAAVAAAVVFLDHRLATLEQGWQRDQEAAAERQRSDSDVLMGIDLKLDRAARGADVERAVAKAADVEAAVETLKGGTDQRLLALQQEVSALRQRLVEVADRSIDYRPLFEDLRDRHQRALAAIETVRALAAAPVVAVPAPGPAEPAPAAASSGLPDDLAAHVAKLTAADPAVRFEAVDLLVESKNELVLPHLLPLAKDPDSFVRRLTVEGLREFARPESVDALLAALDDEDENVRDTAWRSLRDVTGQKFPFEATATKDSRARAIRRWQEWWEGARATFGS